MKFFTISISSPIVDSCGWCASNNVISSCKATKTKNVFTLFRRNISTVFTLLLSRLFSTSTQKTLYIIFLKRYSDGIIITNLRVHSHELFYYPEIFLYVSSQKMSCCIPLTKVMTQTVLAILFIHTKDLDLVSCSPGLPAEYKVSCGRKFGLTNLFILTPY